MKFYAFLTIFCISLSAYGNYQKNCDQVCLSLTHDKPLTSGEYSTFTLVENLGDPTDRVQLIKVFLWMIMDPSDKTPCEKGFEGSRNHGTRAPLWDKTKEVFPYEISKVWFSMGGPWQVCAHVLSKNHGEKKIYIDIDVATK
jgi:hypothetical protein